MFSLESCQHLRQVYSTATRPDVVEGVSNPALQKAESDALYARLHRFATGCMPMITPNNDRHGFQSWLKSKWIWRIASYLSCNFSPSWYLQTCHDDMEKTVQLMNEIAGTSEAVCPLETKAFILHNLISHVIAYRPSPYFQTHPAVQLPLPVRKNGAISIKPCRFEREVNLFGGVTTKIFVPCDGQGSATYLFSGTTPWLLADGAGIGLLDDFNPFGPGEGLRWMAHHRLKPFLERHVSELGEPAMMVGHSLGGIIPTSLAVDLPDLIGQVVAFNVARPSHRLANQWNELCQRVSIVSSKSLPKIDTFITYYKHRPDIVSRVGSCWIGDVWRVEQSHDSDPIHRHAVPTGSCFRGAAIAPLDTEEANRYAFRRYGWAAVIHTLIALPIAITLFVLLVLKRLFVGWNSGGIWRYGLLGVPFRVYTQTS